MLLRHLLEDNDLETVPTLTPGTTQDLPTFEKFSKILSDLKYIQDYIKAHKKHNTDGIHANVIKQQQERGEELSTQMSKDAVKVLDYIMKNCGDYELGMLRTGKFLYRGTQDNEAAGRSAFIGNSRENRRPKDSSSKASEQFNHCLKELGIEALRSNSIFTTSDLTRTGSFGDPYIIFPLNSAKFSWTNQDDLVLDESKENNWFSYSSDDPKFDEEFFNEIKNRFTKPINEFRDNYVNLPYDKRTDALTDIYDYYGSIYNRIGNNFRSIENDFYLLDQVKQWCSPMYLNNRERTKEWDLLRELYQFLTENLPKFNKHYDIDKFEKIYEPKDTDFEGALNSQHEICIKGHYLALSYYKWYNLLLKELLGKDPMEFDESLSEAGSKSGLTKVPTLAPGTSQEIPKLSKFGVLAKQLRDIQGYIKDMVSYPDRFTQKKKDQIYTQKTKLLSQMSKDQEKILNYINTHCSNYVREMQTAGSLLYRGIKKDEAQDRISFIGNSRTNRKPKDSSARISKEFNKILTKLGIEANRSNSIFTTSYKMRTLNFGTTYIIFPLNSAKFSWTTARDLVLDNHSDADWSSYTSGNLKYDDEFKSKMENINEYITKRRQGFWVASPESQKKNRYEHSINSDVINYVYVISKNLNKVYFKRIIDRKSTRLNSSH